MTPLPKHIAYPSVPKGEPAYREASRSGKRLFWFVRRGACVNLAEGAESWTGIARNLDIAEPEVAMSEFVGFLERHHPALYEAIVEAHGPYDPVKHAYTPPPRPTFEEWMQQNGHLMQT